jgi:Nucleotidyltransferase substrate binding protein like
MSNFEKESWKQLLKYYGNSLGYFEKAMSFSSAEMTYDASFILFFLSTCDIGWRSLKSYLQTESLSELVSTRSIIKNALEQGLIKNGEAWMELMKWHGLNPKQIDAESLLLTMPLIRQKYFPLLKALHIALKKK